LAAQGELHENVTDGLIARAVVQCTRPKQYSAGLYLETVPQCIETWVTKNGSEPEYRDPADPLRQQQREQAESLERERWIKENLLADRYADAKEVELVLESYPELRGYTPPPEHWRAVDTFHVRHALFDISRPNCPSEIKREQRRRLEELERHWPGIIGEVKARGLEVDAESRRMVDKQKAEPQGTTDLAGA
jgi:hypothetical protein